MDRGFKVSSHRTSTTDKMSLVPTKHVLAVSDQVRHNPHYTTTYDGSRLEFRTYEEEGLYFICSKNKGADQLRV